MTPEEKWMSLLLWFQKPCLGGTVWFLNEAHLAFTEAYWIDPRDEQPSEPAWLPSLQDEEAIRSCLQLMRAEMDESENI